jgi:hypothetical protein
MKVTLIVNRETSIYRHFGKKTNILKKSTKFKSPRKITLYYKKNLSTMSLYYFGKKLIFWSVEILHFQIKKKNWSTMSLYYFGKKIIFWSVEI